MTRKGKISTQARGARLFIAALAVLAALLASCENLITRTPPADVGGGYEPDASAENGALTVTASVSGGAARYAMPSLTVSEFSYAALLYPDGSPADSGFVAETIAEEASTENRKLTFSFTRPENPNGDFTLEILAFKKGTNTAFSRSAAILSGSAPVKVGTADTISINETILLEINSSYTGTKGTVSLKVQVPAECTLEIDDTENFALTGTSPNFTVTHNGDGIAAGAHPLTLTVKKGGSPLYVLSEHINVLSGLETNTWSGEDPGEPRVINEESFSTTVYVRGTGGWYEGSPYASTATVSENNFGSFLSPLATIQKAVDKVLAMNDGTSAYTIYVDGTLTQNEDATASSMASFSALSKNLSLTIKALSGTATLDAGKKGRVVNAAGNGELNLTMENLVLRNGTTSEFGGGAYFENGTFAMKGCEITGNESGYGGGGVFVEETATLTMTDCKVDGNEAQYGGGIFVNETATLTIEGGTVNTNEASDGAGIYVAAGTLTMEGDAVVNGNNASSIGGGILVHTGGTVTMNGGTITQNTATNGGGVYVDGSKFNMSGSTISDNEANGTGAITFGGGGVYIINSGKFNMTSGTISDNETSGYGGGVYVRNGLTSSKSTFTMSGGKITKNTASNSGGGVCATSYNTNFTMSDGSTISENSATADGGGVYVGTQATLEMRGGTIGGSDEKSGNYSSGNGGGVYVVTNGTLAMTGGEIKRNRADTNGNGVYVDRSSSAKFNMSGGAKVADDNDVYIVYFGSTLFGTITVAGELNAATPVATITPSSYAEDRQVLSAGSGVTLTQTICDKFALSDDSWTIEPSDDGTQGVLKQVENAFYVRGSNAPWYASNNPSAQASDSNVGSRSLPFATIQKAVDKVIAENDGAIEYTIFIDGTFTATSTAALADFNSSEKTLTVKIAGMDSSNKAVIDGNGTAIGIAVGSRYEQRDVNLSLENLIIQNAKNSIDDRGGGVILSSYEENSHTIKNCELKNNNASFGSAIMNKYGSLDMKNCVVSGNTTGTSGTVYIGYASMLTISNVTIENNSANNGGGIFIGELATVKISDSSVVISGNSIKSTTTARGAGISVWNGYLELSGSAKIEDVVGLYGDQDPIHEIHITGALTGTSPVATLALSSSYSSGKTVLFAKGQTITQDICDKFAISNSSYKIVPNGDGSQGVVEAK